MVRLELSTLGLVAVATVSALAAVHGFEALAAERPAGGVAAYSPAPVAPVANAPGEARLQRAADGHYWAEATIEGRPVRVLVDTGASVVALTRDDALRLGRRLVSSDFDQTVQTASGPARAARIQLSRVAVDGARVDTVEALVVEHGLEASLLGMSYLGRLRAFEATPETLTLRA